MCRMGDDRSEVAQPMHSLDRKLLMSVVEVHKRARKYAISSPGAKAVPLGGGRCSPSPAVVGGSSRRLSAAVATRDDRPCARVGGRFAGEVAGVELGDGGVEIVEVEHDRAAICRRTSISRTSDID